MELTQDKIDLISKIIKNDRKFGNNEDLYDDFFNETCKRSLSVIEVLDSDPALESYLRRIVSTSILNVLKDSGRLKRTRSGYKPTKEISIDTTQSLEKSISTKDYHNIKIDYSCVVIPKTPEDFAIQKDILEFVARSIKTIDFETPEKQYLRIFRLRYDNGMTQKEISEQLNISQSEVSKRLYQLMKKVRSIVD